MFRFTISQYHALYENVGIFAKTEIGNQRPDILSEFVYRQNLSEFLPDNLYRNFLILTILFVLQSRRFSPLIKD